MNEPRFLDREAELTALTEAHAAASRSLPRLMLVGGDAGIGKTALVRHFLGRVSTAPGAVAWASTPVAIGDQTPYASVIELARSVATSHPEVLAQLGPARADLGVLLPEVRDQTASSLGPESDPTFARVRLLDALRGLFEGAAARAAPLTLVVDDLHWADAASLELLSYLTRQVRDKPLLTIATYRTDRLSDSPQLERLLVELVRLDNVAHLHLAGIDRGQLQALAGNLSGAQLDELIRRSGGNPYFFLQLASHPNQTDGLPTELRHFLRLRLDALSPVLRRVAQVTAVAGPLAGSRLIAAVTDLPEAEVTAALRALVRQGVIEIGTASGDVPVVSGPLLQELIAADMLPSELAELHGAIAARLQADPQLSGGEPASAVDIARHLAGASADRSAVPALLRGALAAEQQRAYELAHALLERVIALADRSAGVGASSGASSIELYPAGGFASLVDVQLRAAEMAHLSGQPERAIELARQALGGERDREPHAWERLAAYGLAAGDPDAALAAYDRALSLAGESSDEVSLGRTLASRGRTLLLLGKYPEAFADLERAVEIARSAGARADESRALRTLASVLGRMGDREGAAARLGEARLIDDQRGGSVVAPRPSQVGYLIAGLLDRAGDLERAGSLEDAAAAAAEAAAAARHLGATAAWGGLVAATAAAELFLLGRWSEADEMLASESVGSAAAPAAELTVTRARLAAARGELDTAQVMVGKTLDSLRSASPLTIAAMFLVLAEIALWQGRPAEARDATEQALTRLETSRDDVLAAEAACLALQANAQRAAAARARRAWVELQAIREDSLGLVARSGLAPADPDPHGGRLAAVHTLAEAWLSAVLCEGDAGRWRLAVESFDALREPYSAALARWMHAETLLSQRKDRATAEASLRSAFAAARDLGAVSLSRELEGLARRARVDLSQAPEKGTMQGGPNDELSQVRRQLGLSEREVEVLALIAEGRTNRQIAEELFITEKTAGHHVSNILTKLTVTSRVEAAAVAHRAGLLALIEKPAV